MNRVGGARDSVPIRRVLASAWDKNGLVELIGGLADVQSELVVVASGGTYRALDEAAVLPKEGLVELAEFTGQPEMQGGLVKSLDFRVYAALLSEGENPEHRADLERLAIAPFDMVVVNLYPFEAVIEGGDCDLEEARGHIDIGGPTMLRAAAKNFLRVAAVCDPSLYPDLIVELRASNGCLSLRTRFDLARRTFSRIASYDQAISSYLDTLDPAGVEGVYDTGAE